MNIKNAEPQEFASCKIKSLTWNIAKHKICEPKYLGKKMQMILKCSYQNNINIHFFANRNQL